MMGGRKRVGIIGGGVSGLLAIKCCLDEDLDPVCLERTDKCGGLWRYTEETKDGQGCVMKSTVINTSKEMMAFSDFPIPADFPNFMHNTKVIEYFEHYAKHFDLMKHIQYKQEVLLCKRADDFSTTGKWKVQIKDHNTGDEREEIFDAVLLCTGHHADKNVAVFPGQEEFEGKIVHTHDYRSHKGYEDQRVIVVGIGNSGGDVAVELSKISSQVYLSTRRGAWVGNRIHDCGIPMDMNLTKRVNQKLVDLVPDSISNAILEYKLNQRFNHALYGLKPAHRFNAQHPTVNDDLPNRIASGAVVVKPNVRKITKTGVEFEDGSLVDNIDVIILATGFKFGFPFLEEGIIEVKNNKVDLYKNMFPPELSPPSLAAIGFFQPLGAIMPIAELQCRWATRVFKGTSALPPKDQMWEDIRAKHEAMASRYVESSRHTIQVDWIPFMDEIAEQVGCKPDLWKMLFRDPQLAISCFCGPCTPYQFRLQGPLPWKGARKAILTQWQRVEAPLKTRNVDDNADDSFTWWKIILAVIVLAILLKLIF